MATVLVRTPYSRKSPASRSYRYFARRGYAVVVEDVRGRFASQGTFGNIAQEGAGRQRHDQLDSGAAVVERARGDGGRLLSRNGAMVGGARGQPAPGGYLAGLLGRRRISGPLLLDGRRAEARTPFAVAFGESHAAIRRPRAAAILHTASAGKERRHRRHGPATAAVEVGDRHPSFDDYWKRFQRPRKDPARERSHAFLRRLVRQLRAERSGRIFAAGAPAQTGGDLDRTLGAQSGYSDS